MESLQQSILISPDFSRLGYLFLKGYDVDNLSQDHQLNLAKQAVFLMEKLGGEHMFHPPAEKILKFMQAGHTAIITDHSLRQLWGFVKLDPWFKPSANIPGEGIGNITIDDVTRAGLYFPVGVEVGSLVVVPQHQNKGFGKFLAKEASSLSEEIYPGIPRIAVVTNDNLSSLHVFTKIGWIGVSPEEAKYIMQGVDVLEGWTPPSTIFVDPLSFPGLHNY